MIVKRAMALVVLLVVLNHLPYDIQLSFMLSGHVTNAGYFETTAPNDPQKTLTTRILIIHPHTYQNYPRVPNFPPFHSTDNHFRVTGYFETSASKHPPPHQVTTCTYHNYPESQIQSFSLYGRPSSSYRTSRDKCTE